MSLTSSPRHYALEAEQPWIVNTWPQSSLHFTRHQAMVCPATALWAAQTLQMLAGWPQACMAVWAVTA